MVSFLPRSPGYGITLVAETTTGVMYAAEGSSLLHTAKDKEKLLPEDLGRQVAASLVQAIVKVIYMDDDSLFWYIVSFCNGC